MAMILVPAHYYDKGIIGTANKFNLTMNSQLTGFEAYKAFTTDDREYLKYTGPIVMENPYTQNLTQGAVVISDMLLNDLGNKLYLQKDTSPAFSNPVNKMISFVYGDGQNSITYLDDDKEPIGLTKSLVIYSSTDSVYQYYRFLVTGQTNVRIQHLAHGYIYNLPEGYLIEDRSYQYQYKGSEVKTNLVGNIYWNGYQNNGVKKEHTLRYEYLNENDKNMLLDIFKLGKGGLPVWFINNTADKNSWMYASIKTMVVEMPYAEYYHVTLKLEEY